MSVRYGTEAVSFLGPEIWDNLPNEKKILKRCINLKQK